MKGQITFYIALAIVILLVLASVYYAPPSIERMETSPYHSQIESCVDRVLEDGIDKFGMQGGYTELGSTKVLSTEVGSVAYWYDKKLMSRTENDAEIQISKYIEQNLGTCISKLGLRTEAKGEVLADVTLQPGKVTANVRYPLEITEGEVKTSAQKFRGEKEVRLRKALMIANEIAASIEKSPTEVPISLMGSYDMLVTLYDQDSDTSIIAVRDPESIIGDGSLVLMFGINWEVEQ